MRHRDRSSERQNTRSFALLFMLQRTVRLYKCLTSIKIDYMIIMRQRQRYLNVNRSTNQSSIDNTDKQEQLVNDFSHEHSSRSLQTQRDHNNQNCGAEVDPKRLTAPLKLLRLVRGSRSASNASDPWAQTTSRPAQAFLQGLLSWPPQTDRQTDAQRHRHTDRSSSVAIGHIYLLLLCIQPTAWEQVHWEE